MKVLNIIPQTIREFEKDDVLNFSAFGAGILYWIDDNMAEKVKEFEEQYNCLVYHVIHSVTEFGELLSFLYVSSDREEWEDDRNDLNYMVEDYKGIKFLNPYAYVYNMSEPDFSEFGRIGIIPMNGGVKRIY